MTNRDSSKSEWPFDAPPPKSLVQSPFFIPVKEAIVSALEAVHPARAVRQALKQVGHMLCIEETQIDLDAISRIRVIGGGKGAQPMAAALFDILDSRIETGAVVVKKGEASALKTGFISVIESAHPIPDETSLNAARTMLSLTRDLSPSDFVFVLISGGASSLLTLPAHPLNLSDLQQTTHILINAGIDISAFNTVRKHLSAIKGGNLARHIHPARFMTLILSDVVGDSVEAIGSGPTAPDNTTFKDAFRILEQVHAFHKLPLRVQTRILSGVRGEIPDTPSADHPAYRLGTSHIVGSNRMAAKAAATIFEKHGLKTRMQTSLTGEARDVGRQLIADAKKADSHHAWVFGGETTVTVTGQGRGGRNQELALSAALAMKDSSNMLLITVATDGGDGPTNAAGAVATPKTYQRGMAHDLCLETHLENNDAYPFFKTLGDLLITGPTQTNVADLTFLLKW